MKTSNDTIGNRTCDLKLKLCHLFTEKLEDSHTLIKDEVWKKCLEILFHLNIVELAAGVGKNHTGRSHTE